MIEECINLMTRAVDHEPFFLDKKRVYDSYGVDGLKRNRNNFHHRNNGPSFSSSFYHPRDPFDIFKNFFGSFDNFHQSHRQQHDNSFGRDPFENFFQNHSNLHRHFFNSPFHSAPNVYLRPSIFKSGPIKRFSFSQIHYIYRILVPKLCLVICCLFSFDRDLAHFGQNI